ncbi:DUF3080 family protein [Phytohalomonas tamaricis]|uniref:DUF3080 family protein n=1 Tax=Phytohalomonas tamaricis TaxID=2081032 RepID=UPI000D0B02A2|nr:DUF3080 family protein [Phytohalomonas tamaricis]
MAKGLWILLLSSLVLLEGCSERHPADALLVDYQQRVSRALETSMPEPAIPPNFEALPAREARLFELEPLRTGMLDIYALRECGLVSLVAARNNQLGKVAVPSHRWVYELTLWRVLYGCKNSQVPERLSPNNRANLDRFLTLKTEQLPYISWNALFDSREWVESFTRSALPIAPEEDLPLTSSIQALDYLRYATAHQFDSDWQPEVTTIDAQFHVLDNNLLSARLLRSLLLVTQRLDELSTVMEKRLETRPICYRGHSNPQADILYNVFLHYYVGRVQPYLALTQRSSQQWFSAVNALLDQHTVSRPEVAHYQQRWLSFDTPHAPWQRYQHAMSRHIALWQQIWQSCGRMPGSQ